MANSKETVDKLMERIKQLEERNRQLEENTPGLVEENPSLAPSEEFPRDFDAFSLLGERASPIGALATSTSTDNTVVTERLVAMESKLSQLFEKMTDLTLKSELNRKSEDSKSSCAKREEPLKVKTVPVVKPKESEISNLCREFDSSLELVDDHKLLLTVEDYLKLASLELLAGVANGPAFRFLNSKTRTDDTTIEDERRAFIKVLRGYGIDTAEKGMAQYAGFCDRPSEYPPETCFFYVEADQCRKYHILAISKHHLRLINQASKEEMTSWPVSKMQSCALLSIGLVKVNFTDGRTVLFNTSEGINTELYRRFRLLLSK